MEDLRSALMEDSERFVEFDEFLESLDAPRFFDFTAIDNSRPDGPSWFCDRIGCNQDHEHVDPEALHRSFKHRVRTARTPTLKRQKPPKLDGPARPTQEYAHSAPAKPAASARAESVASRALVFATPKKMTTRETCTSTTSMPHTCAGKLLADCPELTSNKGEKSDTTNSKAPVISEMPDSLGSICSISETSSNMSVIPASSQGTQPGTVENAMAANKENVPNSSYLEENCENPKIRRKAIKDSRNHHGERETSKRATKPKPFKLLTNERRIQRETNLEKKLNSEAKRETVSALRSRDGMKNNQTGKRVQKPQPSEATLARGKMVKLAEEKLIKRKAECQRLEGVKEELGEKTHEEIVKGTSSKQSVRNRSLMAPRNAHTSSSNRNKVIKANTCTQVKKSPTAQQATESAFLGRDGVTENQTEKMVQKSQLSEARLAHGKSVRLARTKLITSHTQCQKENQIDRRVPKPHPSEARLDHGKSVRLARAKLITSNPQCQKENQIDKRVPKPQASEARLDHGKSVRLVRAKLITSNPQIDKRVQKPQPSEAILDHGKRVRLAGAKLITRAKLITSNPRCQESENSKDKLEETSRNEVVKVASSKQLLKTQSLMAPRNAHSSSSHGNKVITANAHSQEKKSTTAQGATGSAIVSRDGHNPIDSRVQKPQRIEAGHTLSKIIRVAGGNLLTENSHCLEAEISKEKLEEKSRKEVTKVASSSTRQRFKTPSLIEARNASSSSTQETKLTTSSQWRKSATAQKLTASTIRCPDGSKIEAKLAHSKMVRFVGDKSIVSHPQCQKSNKDKLREKLHEEAVNVGTSRQLDNPSLTATQNAQSSAPHGDGDGVIIERACSQEKSLATTPDDSKLHQIHVSEGCLKKPEMTIS